MTSNINNTQEHLHEKYSKLPKDIQGVLLDENLGPWIHTIGKRNGIDPLQSLAVEDEVFQVLLGTKNRKNLAINIMNELGIETGRAGDIAQDINTSIFEDIKDSLEKTHGPDEGAVKIKTPGLPTDTERPSLAESLHKKVAPPVPPATPPAPPTPTVHTATVPIPPVPPAPPTPPKPIIGAEKVGKDLPPAEHMFEEKLRSVMKPTQAESPIKKAGEEVVPGGFVPPKPSTEPKRMDPYREATD